jgi:redox-sensitive bicupin YhaK (pirin superfamily)
MHGMQAWVALPREDEEIAPAFAHHSADALPELSDRGVWARLIAGSAYGLSNDVRTFSPLYYLHAELAAGASMAMPTDHAERAAYVVSGAVVHDGVRHEAGRMLVFSDGGEPVISAEDAPARVMLLGGASVGPRFIWWNLVSSRRGRIEQAKADWKAGRMALPPDDDQEFIPLPDELPPSAEPTHRV